MIRILLADDHKIVRDGLRALLAQDKDMKVIGEARDGLSAVELALAQIPDVIIMDVSMPEISGIEATRQIVERHPGIKVIALSMHSDKRYVSGILSAGAAGYLLKDCAFEELGDAIRKVIADEVYLSPGITGVVVQDYIERLEQGKNQQILSSREREVLKYLADGQNTKEIAYNLNVSVKTVETHRRRVMEKLNLQTMAELTKYAIRNGLTSL